ncbi:ATP-binding cassette domain-containing protein [Georgenia sp. MJ206]|uniref:ABC transporter ATP-binding protein n=1 Tax=Georgenia wangjunii TaxID=3117730 RepID=UPI002F261014
MSGRREPLEAARAGARGDDGAPTLAVDGLTFAVGGVTILDGVDATVPAGAVSAVVGPNGSGKSTLLRLVAGALTPTAGTLRLDGADLTAMPARERARLVALVEQDSTAEVHLHARDVVLLGRVPHRARWGADSPADLAVAEAALARTGAADLAGRDFATLSGGERQRVHLARAIAQVPHLLMLDEPTNHLDVGAQLAVLGLACELADDGVPVLAALHDLNHALRYCDHVVVLDAGRVTAAGPPAEVLSEALVSRVYGVRARRVHAGGRDLLLFDPV